jgi:4-carboxymuconolactone decarboxylase
MSLPLAITDFGGSGPALLLGPSLGTAARTLWAPAAERLVERFHVLAWDLPGHGASPTAEGFTVADLAAALRERVDGPFGYAGVSVGGAVGLELLLQDGERIEFATLISTGAHDPVTTPATLRHVAEGVQHGRLAVLDDASHQAPAEAPSAVAQLVADAAQWRPAGTSVEQLRAAGMRVRREVLGDAHVDRASAQADDLTAEFQQFITRYAWGSIWTRPGLDRRSRSLITLTALVARGHHDELAMHLRAARRNGLSTDEIKELLLQTAIYCGVPDANTAFRIAQRVFAEEDDE